MIDYGIAGRVAIVTGGSRGIGRACAMALAEQGVDICLTARRQNLLDETAKEIQDATGVQVLTVAADMSSDDDVKRMVQTTSDHFGHIDILVNNAASFPYGSSLELSVDEWISHFQIKAFGYLRCMFAAYPHMQRNHWGRIINIAGQAAREGGGSAGANNSAIINMTKGFALDLAKDGITVNAVHPGGPADSDREPMRLEYQARERGITVEQATAEAEKNIPPIGRRVVTADAANLVLFLASAQADAITGETMAIDAGANRTVIY
ncbi:MAG: SDR family oxidoreductase [Dehalococcoidia bacterium]